MEQHSPQDKTKMEMVRVRKVSVLLSWYSCWLTILIPASVTHEEAFNLCFRFPWQRLFFFDFWLFVFLGRLAHVLSVLQELAVGPRRTSSVVSFSHRNSLQLLSKEWFSCKSLVSSPEINMCMKRDDTLGCCTYSHVHFCLGKVWLVD